MNQDNLQSKLVHLTLCDSDKDGKSGDDSRGNEWNYNNVAGDSTMISNQPNPPPAIKLIQELQEVQQNLPMDMESSNDQPIMPLIVFGEPTGIQMNQVETAECMPIKIASDILELASLDQNTAISTANPTEEKLEDHQQQVATTSLSEKLSVDVVVSNGIEKKKSPGPSSKSPDKKQTAASLASKPGVKKPLPNAKALKKTVDSVGPVSKAPISSRPRPKPPTTATSPPKKVPLAKQPPPPFTSTKTTAAKPTTATNVSKSRTATTSVKPPTAVVKKPTITLPLKTTLKSPTKASDLPSDKAKTCTTTTTKPLIRATTTSITRSVSAKGLANGDAGPGKIGPTAKKALTSTSSSTVVAPRVTRPAPKTTTTGSSTVRPPTTAPTAKPALTNGGTRPVQKNVNGTTPIKPATKVGVTKKTTIQLSSPIKDVKINPSKPEGENLIIDEPIVGHEPIVYGPIIGESIIDDQKVAEPIIDIISTN